MQVAASARSGGVHVECEMHSKSHIVQPNRAQASQTKWQRKNVRKNEPQRLIFIHVTLALALRARPNTIVLVDAIFCSFAFSPLVYDLARVLRSERLLQRSAQRQRGKHADQSRGRRVRDVTHYSPSIFSLLLVFFPSHWKVKLRSAFDGVPSDSCEVKCSHNVPSTSLEYVMCQLICMLRYVSVSWLIFLPSIWCNFFSLVQTPSVECKMENGTNLFDCCLASHRFVIRLPHE